MKGKIPLFALLASLSTAPSAISKPTSSMQKTVETLAQKAIEVVRSERIRRDLLEEGETEVSVEAPGENFQSDYFLLVKDVVARTSDSRRWYQVDFVSFHGEVSLRNPTNWEKYNVATYKKNGSLDMVALCFRGPMDPGKFYEGCFIDYAPLGIVDKLTVKLRTCPKSNRDGNECRISAGDKQVMYLKHLERAGATLRMHK